jgi:hypothetical protein
VVISVRNYMVGLGVDTLYCAWFLIGGAFDPFVVPPCTLPDTSDITGLVEVLVSWLATLVKSQPVGAFFGL